MKARSHSLSPSVARGIAILCAVVFVASARTAWADSTPTPRATLTPTSVGFCGGAHGTCTPTATPTITPTPTNTGTPTPTAVIHWTSHGPGSGDTSVFALAIDPTTPTTLYAATNGGVFKSTDGAMSWRTASTRPSIYDLVTAFAIDHATSTTVYAATGFCGGGDPGGCGGNGVFKSTDGAGSWQAVNAGLDTSVVIALAIDPITPTTLYAGTAPPAPDGLAAALIDESGGDVFKSTDGASNWRAANAGLPKGGRVFALAIDPKTPSTLYAGTAPGNVFKTTDGGNIWSDTRLDQVDPVRALAIDPKTPSTLYAATYGGVYKSTDGAASWQAVAGLLDYVFYALATDPLTPSTLYAAGQGGVFKSTDGATSWQALNAGLSGPYGVAANALAIDPTTPTTLYAGTDSGVFSIEQVPAAGVVGTGTAASCTDAALNAALAGGGLVTFNCGGPATIDISTGTGTKTIAADTTIDGGGLITISGGNSVGVFSVNSGIKFTVVNLTIANGHAGIVVNPDTSLTVTNSTFSGNSGPGIVSFGGSLAVINSTFSGNSSDLGGGGIFNEGATLTVTNSTFTHNSRSAIRNIGTLTVTNSTFTGNRGDGIDTADYRGVGGGGGALTVTNSAFTSNSGYGIAQTHKEISAISSGSFSASRDSFDSTGLRNTIVANNTGGNCYGDGVHDGGHNLDDGTTCGFSTANGSLSNTNPQLDPAGLQDNGGPTQTVALCTAVGVPAGCSAASPAIDAGDQAVCVAAPVYDLDQRGFVRPGIGHTQCSVGAYEADATAAEPCTGDCNANSSVTVDEIITLVNIALGTAQPAACPHAVPSSADVNVTMIIQAVNNALNGCTLGQ